MIINWIDVGGESVTVGACSQDDWDYERGLGKSGAYARSSVWVAIDGSAMVSVGIMDDVCCDTPPDALGVVIRGLRNVAHDIKEQGMDTADARAAYFGCDA